MEDPGPPSFGNEKCFISVICVLSRKYDKMRRIKQGRKLTVLDLGNQFISTPVQPDGIPLMLLGSKIFFL